MADNLKLRLSRCELQFISAISESPEAIQSFYQTWSSLQLDLEESVKSQSVDQETLELAFQVASRVEIFAERFSDLFAAVDTLAVEFRNDLDAIFSGLLIDESLSTHGMGLEEAPVRPPRSSNTCAQYIEPAYKWLLQNLHNPYPTREDKASFLRHTTSTKYDLDNWFVDARKRMGWNSLRKSRFSNRRVDIIDAATRFFIRPDAKRPLDPCVELEFAEIEARAKDLYSDKFIESPLATKLDVAVKDLTSDMKKQVKDQKKRLKQADRLKRDAAFYPSPERSPGTSPERHLQSQDDLSQINTSQNSLNLKRSSPSSESDDSDNTERPHKRTRLDPSSSSFDSAYLPSPAPSLHEISDDCGVLPSTMTPLTVAPSLTIPTKKRKRFLSDVSGQDGPKRPQDSRVTPRLQTSSDPFPTSKAIPTFDEWYQNTFTAAHRDIPDAVSVKAPDATTPLDIEIYNFSPYHAQATLSPAASLSDSVITVATPITESDYVCNAWFELDHCSFPELVSPEVNSASINELVLPFNLCHPSTDEVVSQSILPLLDWRDCSSLSQTAVSPPHGILRSNSKSPDVMAFGLDLTNSFTGITYSLHSSKEEKQMEPFAMQQRLSVLEAELAATPR
ncbi:hypothetical protein K443DRAFT_684017 [Laccaria amethystina LaAM-08-1]|uniref:Unplaced genomic scaffold K443scaffold_274, whole genome shotgun sequence n=1 Tax=Laccaria amethystina LaAM-08-1 TaxID=1095629 RepID=A0A0C9XD35_9AGAR|nr:hypothetical protein K443DRAFT_684017 [Laccaria amethystina LaAM-08-1]